MIRRLPAVSAGAERQRSLALAGLVPRLDGEARAPFSVLDLGPASPNNLEFFARNGVRLTVADLYRGFGHQRRSTELLSKLLRYEGGDRFDLVLAWDVLNYLKRDELGVLVESLATHLCSGTLIHAFIVTAREMAPEPISYRIEDGRTLICGPKKGRPIRAPRYVEPELLRSMPSLTVEHCFRLRNGMAEYVFTYRPRQRGELASVSASTSTSAPSPASFIASPPARLERVTGWTPAPSR